MKPQDRMEAQVALLKSELEKAQAAHVSDVARLEHKFLEDKNRVQKAHADAFQVRVPLRAGGPRPGGSCEGGVKLEGGRGGGEG